MAQDGAAKTDAKVTPEDLPEEPRIKEIVCDLKGPAYAYGDKIKQLKFRRPTGGDMMAMGEGYPIVINYQLGQVLPNPAVMGPLMSLLGNVPLSTIKELDAEDWSSAAFKLVGFFAPGT
jgi:hypothetical protein